MSWVQTGFNITTSRQKAALMARTSTWDWSVCGIDRMKNSTGRATSLDLLKLKSAPRQPRATARQGVPPAPGDPFANFNSQTALKHWDRERGFVPATSKFPMADLYVCWDSSALYFGLYLVDPVEPEYYRDGNAGRHPDHKSFRLET
jgi:hypothetical protein